MADPICRICGVSFDSYDEYNRIPCDCIAEYTGPLTWRILLARVVWRMSVFCADRGFALVIDLARKKEGR